MKVIKFITLFLVLIFLHTHLTKAAELILQNGLNNYNGCGDTYLDSEIPQNNYGRISSIKLRDETIIGG